MMTFEPTLSLDHSGSHTAMLVHPNDEMPGDIIVVGDPGSGGGGGLGPGVGSGDSGGNGGYNPNPTLTGDPGGGGPSAPYQSPGRSAEANAFADAHLKDEGIFSDDHTVFREDHDDLAKLYDTIADKISDQLYLGDGKVASLVQEYVEISQAVIHITDDFLFDLQSGQQVGAQTIANDDGTLNVYLNTGEQQSENYENLNTGQYDYYGTSGIDYQLFHELGHVVQYFEDRALYDLPSVSDGNASSPREAQANTIGMGLENEADIRLLSNYAGTPVTPSFGYLP